MAKQEPEVMQKLNKSLLEKWNKLIELEKIIDQNIEDVKKLNANIIDGYNQIKTPGKK